MNNSKIFLILGCFCVLILISISCVYEDHKEKQRAEYQRIVSEAHQQMEDLKHWKKSNRAN